MLLDIVDRVTDELEDKAVLYRELDAINLQTAGHRTYHAKTPRRGAEAIRADLQAGRMFDLLPKILQTGA